MAAVVFSVLKFFFGIVFLFSGKWSLVLGASTNVHPKTLPSAQSVL